MRISYGSSDVCSSDLQRRADRQVEVAVDDDEGHADRHHPVAGGVAQRRPQGMEVAEEFGVDQRAGGIQHAHEDQQADLPSEAGEWPAPGGGYRHGRARSEEHTSELQSLMRTSYAVFCFQQQKTHTSHEDT